MYIVSSFYNYEFRSHATFSMSRSGLTFQLSENENYICNFLEGATFYFKFTNLKCCKMSYKAFNMKKQGLEFF